MGIVETVVRDLADLPVLHEAKLPQGAKRVRHRRLGGSKNYRDVTHAKLPACQSGYDAEARGIPKCLERLGERHNCVIVRQAGTRLPNRISMNAVDFSNI